jgi:hypothetical protein
MSEEQINKILLQHQKNAEYRNEFYKKYQKERRLNDDEYRLKQNEKSRIASANKYVSRKLKEVVVAVEMDIQN